MKNLFFTLWAILLIATMFAQTSCVVYDKNENASFHTVDGVQLKYENEAKLMENFSFESLEVEGGTMTVNVIGQAKPQIELQIKYMEYKPGDATLAITAGKIVATTLSGKPISIISVAGKIPNEIDVIVNSGTGSVALASMQSKNVSLDLGTGAVNVAGSEIGQMVVNNGTGDIGLQDSKVNMAEISTGTGDVSLQDSKVNMAEISTGTGDIIMKNSTVLEQDFSTGTGKVISE